MGRALINPGKCMNYPECNVVALCPAKALIQEEATDMPWVDFLLCRGCMKCLKYCANDAVLEEIKPCTVGRAMSW